MATPELTDNGKISVWITEHSLWHTIKEWFQCHKNYFVEDGLLFRKGTNQPSGRKYIED